MNKNTNENSDKIKDLEIRLSELKFELEEVRTSLEEEKAKRQFYQFVADFTFGWELWFEPNGNIKFCSPSCFDLTGFTSNQILGSSGISELLVYEPDRQKYSDFLSNSLDQLLVNHVLEFRILTRSKQLRWCMMNVRGVYDKLGKYLGIRASIHDISRLKKAMGHIQEMEVVKELENRTRQRLQSQLTSKDRELVSFLLQLSQKNELLSKITNHIGKMKGNAGGAHQKQMDQIMNLIEADSELSLDWTMIENQVEKIHPGFTDRLQTKHPGISAKERKMCTYMRLGLSSKEISGLLNMAPKSVEIARVRLRKKMKLSSKIRLLNYLNQL
ncbi:MAG: PAS domain S-box protein [Draconibacterium sp.]